MKQHEIWNSWSMADRLFLAQSIEMDVYDEVCRILTGDPDNSDECEDIGWDYYDGSLEVIRTNTSNHMTREQADEILKMGFGRIYESYGDGQAICWNEKMEGKCSPRTGTATTRLKSENIKLKQRLEDRIKLSFLEFQEKETGDI